MTAKTPFERAFVSVPVGLRKIPESEYDSSGTHRVVDQGQGLVAGYTNRSDLLISDGPYIVFGDHTRAVKYIDFPFVAGADGLRLLRAARGFDSEYLFLFLRSVHLRSDGYGRHFKHLKRLMVPTCENDQQRKIVRRLKAQLAEVAVARERLADQLASISSLKSKAMHSVFLEASHWEAIGSVAKVQSGYAFKSSSFKTFGVRLLRNTNILPDKVYWNKVAFLSEAESGAYAGYALTKGDVLISLDRPLISGGIKVARVWDVDLPALLVQRVGRFLIDSEKLDPAYLYAFLQTEFFVSKIRGHDQSLGVPHISPSQVESIEIPLPDISTQRRLAARLKDISLGCSTAEAALQQQINDLSVLDKAILAQAFEHA